MALRLPLPLEASVRLFGWGVMLAAGLGFPALAEERAVPRVTASSATRSETLSSSSQFIAHGPLQADRSKLVSQSERVREDFAILFDRAEAGRDVTSFALESHSKPLTIHLWLQGDAQPPLQPRVYRLEGAGEPTLGLVVARAGLADGEPFRRELIRLLLAERILRKHPEAVLPARSEVVPPWLFTGVVEAIKHFEAGAPGSRFAALFETGQIMPVEEILAARPERLDGTSREIFKASACALVLALLGQPEGPARFRAFLGEMPVRGETLQRQLIRSFPGLALSNHSLEKWWSLEMAQMSQPTAFEPFDAVETDRRITAALVVRVPPAAAPPESSSVLGRWLKNLLPGGKANTPPPSAAPSASPATPATAASSDELVPIEDIDRLMRLPHRGKILAANQMDLAVLALRAFPLHRPILTDYQKVLGLIIRGRTKGLRGRIEGLAARRRELLGSIEEVEDHLNWFEATQRQQPSGSFDGYFRLLDEFEKPPPKSDDPITRYLDEIEREFQN